MYAYEFELRVPSTHVLSFLDHHPLLDPLSYAFPVVFALLLAVFCTLFRLSFAKLTTISPTFRHFLLSPLVGVWLALAVSLAGI